MPDSKPKKPAGSHYAWEPASAGTWLQADYDAFYPPGAVLPEKVAKDDEHTDAVKACIIKKPGKKTATTPSERPWAQ